MKRLVILFLIISLIVVSCSSIKPSNDPKEVAADYIKAFFGGDYKKLKTIVTKSDIKGIDNAIPLYENFQKMNLEITVELGNVQIKETKATIFAKVILNEKGDTYNTTEENAKVVLVVEDGKWVVDMMSSSMNE